DLALKWRVQCYGCLVKCIIGCAYLDSNLPVASHGEVSTGAEMAFPIREQVDVIGAHIHIEHGGVERYTDVRGSLMCTVIDNSHGENVGAETVGIDVQGDGEFVIRCV